MECTIVDVFAETPLSGNQLAVVRGARDLDTAAMQAIALEMNFSETSFVVDEHSGEARVRIFTPTRELPFAGHPTLGTAWVLGHDRDTYNLHLQAGCVQVTFEAGGIAWMKPPPVEQGQTLDVRSAAAMLGLSPDDIDTRYPCVFATVGPCFALIGVNGLDVLRRARVRPDAYTDLLGSSEIGVFAYTEGAYSVGAHFAARMFHHRGLREDPRDRKCQHGFRGAYSLARRAWQHRGRAGFRDRSSVPVVPGCRRHHPRRRKGPSGHDRSFRSRLRRCRHFRKARAVKVLSSPQVAAGCTDRDHVLPRRSGCWCRPAGSGARKLHEGH